MGKASGGWTCRPAQASSSPDEHLFEYVRQGLVARCNRLRQTEEAARELILATGTVVNARSQERLAAANIRLQTAVFVLAAVTFVIGLAQLAIA